MSATATIREVTGIVLMLTLLLAGWASALAGLAWMLAAGPLRI